METNEGNKLIRIFMGKDDDHRFLIDDSNNGRLLYHLSWDWLIPVVEKIRRMNTDFVISFDNNVVVSVDDGTAYFDKVRVEEKINIISAYKACVNFIKWYNENYYQK